jgi:hypothetical protein
LVAICRTARAFVIRDEGPFISQREKENWRARARQSEAKEQIC